MGHKIPWGRDAILFPYKTSDHRKEQERGRQMFYMIFQVQTWMEREVEVLHSLKGKTTGNSSLPLPKLEKPSSFRDVQQADISVYLELSVLWTCPPCVCLFVCFLINIFYLEANCFIILWWFLPYTGMNQPRVYMCPPSQSPSLLPPHPIPLGCPSAPVLSALFHAWNLDWWSISHMVIYMFQCCSLKSSHPRLFPQSPKVCSLHLCLFCCLARRVIVTIFLNSTYMR